VYASRNDRETNGFLFGRRVAVLSAVLSAAALAAEPARPAPSTASISKTTLPRQVLWYADGRRFFLADYPYAARWPLALGEHTFQAKLPYSDVASPPVRVTVQ